MRSQAKSSGIKIPEVHSIGKGLDPNIQPEKHVLKPLEVPQIEPSLGQGRAALRCKIKTPSSTMTSKPIVQVS